jgi:hypothetical protein
MPDPIVSISKEFLHFTPPDHPTVASPLTLILALILKDASSPLLDYLII